MLRRTGQCRTTIDPYNDQLYTGGRPWRNLPQRNIGWRLGYVLASESIRALEEAAGTRASRINAASFNRFSMPFQDLFSQESAGGEVFGEKVDKAAIPAKDVPFLPGELFRELENL